MRTTYVSNGSVIIARRGRTLAEKFCYNVRMCNDGCWYWMGSLDGHGYGIVSGRAVDRKAIKAHRLSYMLFGEKELLGNLDIDHLCRNRRCVNPAHLEPVTRLENCRRAHKRNHCKNGHLMIGKNVMLVRKKMRPHPERRCRQCDAIAGVRARQRRKAEVSPT